MMAMKGRGNRWRMQFATALVAALPSPAVASEWVKMTEAQDGTVVYFDVQSVRRQEAVPVWRPFPVIQAWVKYDFRAVRAERLRETVSLESVDCEGRRSAALSATDYRTDGSVSRSSDWKDWDTRYKPQPPDSIGAKIYRVLCGIDSFDREP